MLPAGLPISTPRPSDDVSHCTTICRPHQKIVRLLLLQLLSLYILKCFIALVNPMKIIVPNCLVDSMVKVGNLQHKLCLIITPQRYMALYFTAIYEHAMFTLVLPLISMLDSCQQTAVVKRRWGAFYWCKPWKKVELVQRLIQALKWTREAWGNIQGRRRKETSGLCMSSCVRLRRCIVGLTPPKRTLFHLEVFLFWDAR